MRYIKLALMCIVLALTGCASGVKYKDMSSSIATLSPDQGRIYFFRSSSMVGAALQPDIRLDGAVVGESKPGGFFYIDSAAGGHEVSTATEVERKLTLMLDKGETKYVKTSISLGVFVGHVTPELVSQEDAMQELPELSYTGTQAVPNASIEVKRESDTSSTPRTSEANSASAQLSESKQKIDENQSASNVTQQSSESNQKIDANQSASNITQLPSVPPVDEPTEKLKPNVFLPMEPGHNRTIAVATDAKFVLGSSSVTVEKMAKQQGCESRLGAGLLDSQGPIESYHVTCLDGRELEARCEFRQCKFRSGN